LCLLERFFARC